ncbi:sugar diacid recognition domain-containing protein [Marinobacter sp. OP 3.4]|uniref:sugar diacid recognition domain-containing protein n=1 Tax=Marinobacter sp. OP 3.4 TaxID=3076501 RepID=UPI002E24F9BD
MLVLDQRSAQRIVDRTMRAIGHSVNVMSPDGLIIASGDPHRVGSLHEAARLVAEGGEPLIIGEQDCDNYPGARPGVNLPVRVEGRLAAVVGISGPPEEVSRFADLVRITAELMLEQVALLEAGQHRRRHIEETLLAACSGKPVPAVWFEQQGLRADSLRVGVIVEARGERAVDEVLAPLVSFLERKGKPVLAVRQSASRLLVFLEAESDRPDSDRIRRLLNLTTRDDVALAVGQTFTTDFELGYQSVQATREVGLRKAPQALDLCYPDLRMAALWHSLSPGWQQQDLQTLIAAVRDERQGEGYLKTLSRFIECNGEVQRCADRLHIHPNTVRYRLRKIHSLTGLSPFSLPDLLLLHLALETHPTSFVENDKKPR